jgi:hypothetical protein
MTGQNPAFQQNSAIYVTAGTTSVPVILGSSGETLCITNLSTSNAWIMIGSSVPLSVARTGYLILPGMIRYVRIGYITTEVAVILDTGSGGVYIERGEGR